MTKNRIHPTAIIGEGVDIGRGVTVGPNAVLLGPMSIGDNVWIGAGASLGAPPEISTLRQVAAWDGDLSYAGLTIESNVVIREYAVVHQGSEKATTVGEGSWLMNRVYLAHDVVVGRGATISAGVSVGGHASLGANCNIGMNAVIHQRRLISPGVMVGMGSVVSRDLPPFSKCYGNPCYVRGVNTFLLSKLEVSRATVEALGSAYREGDCLLGQPENIARLAEIEGSLSPWIALSDRKPARYLPGSQSN